MNIQPSQSDILMPASQPVKRRSWLGWWYRLSCIAEPSPDAPLMFREQFRRARIASIVLLILQVYAITSLPAGFFGTNGFLGILLIVALVVNCIAMALNRFHQLTLAGVLIVLSISMTPITNIMTTPGGLSLATLPLFDLLVITLVICASILPPLYVFPFAFINSAFIVLGILYMPHQPDLNAALKTSAASLVTLPVAIQLVTAFLAFIWVRSASQAIIRADRAEQIAQLEHDIAESRQQIAEQKAQLDSALQEITSALLSARGEQNFNRIMTQGNPLWTIVGPINNMLARMERMRHAEQEYQQISNELDQLLEAIRTAQATNQPVRPPAYASSARLGLFYREIAKLQMKDNMGSSSILPYSPYNNM